jgi:ferritin-like metal-binding protein YciE
MKTKTQSSKGTGTMEESLDSVFGHELTEVYHAQKQLGKLYESMAKAAQNEELKKSFEGQVQNTSLQISRIEKCFEMLELKPESKSIKIIAGLIESAEAAISEYSEGPVRDAALISAAQKIEHYGISTYGTLRTMATAMGKVQCAQLIEENKDEEAETDEELTRIALTINPAAI